MKKTAGFLCALLLIFLLSGCARIYNGSYFSVTEHEETKLNAGSSGPYYQVHTYAGMRAALLELLHAGAESGVIRAVDYEGSVQDDISRVCLDVTRESPIGSYAVEYLTHAVNRILGYDEITVRISYRISEEEREELQSVSALSDLYVLVSEALEAQRPGLSVQIATLAVTERTLTNYVESCYLEHPDRLSTPPGVSVTFYPSVESVTKIIRFDFSYRNSPEEEQTRLTALNEAASALLERMQGSSEAELAICCGQALTERCTVWNSGSTAYDALVEGKADSEGFAMAMQLLCSRCGVESQVVEGKKNGTAHFWNILRIGREAYHADACAAVEAGVEACFLLTDEELMGDYWWDVDRYPRCQGKLTAAEVLSGMQSAEAEAEPEDRKPEDENVSGE